MGSCLGTGREHDVDGRGGHGRGHGSRRGSGFSDSTSSAIHTHKNRPLRQEKIRWKSDIPLTEGQLKSKRDEFWDTAPAFDGKPEIWNALKAAAEASETAGDFQLAQAILDGAGISLPHGSLVECYDELGTRYAIPVYCLSHPINLLVKSEGDRADSPADFSEPVFNPEDGSELKVRIRTSLLGKDVRMVVNTAETVLSAKKRLHDLEEKIEPARQRWYYGGKLLGDRLKIGDVGIPQGHVIQCVVNDLNFDVIRSTSGSKSGRRKRSKD